MSKAAPAAPKRRSPNGVGSNGRIGLSLLPSELQQVTALAKQHNRTMSSMSRLLVLKGLHASEKEAA